MESESPPPTVSTRALRGLLRVLLLHIHHKLARSLTELVQICMKPDRQTARARGDQEGPGPGPPPDAHRQVITGSVTGCLDGILLKRVVRTRRRRQIQLHERDVSLPPLNFAFSRDT